MSYVKDRGLTAKGRKKGAQGTSLQDTFLYPLTPPSWPTFCPRLFSLRSLLCYNDPHV